MTQTQFYALCTNNLIDPSIALENEELVEALQNRDDKEVERIILEDF